MNLTLNDINGNLKLRLYSPFNSLNSYLVCLRFAPDGWWTIGTFLDYKSIRKMLRLIGRIFNPCGYLLYLVQGVPRNMTVGEWFWMSSSIFYILSKNLNKLRKKTFKTIYQLSCFVGHPVAYCLPIILQSAIVYPGYIIYTRFFHYFPPFLIFLIAETKLNHCKVTQYGHTVCPTKHGE